MSELRDLTAAMTAFSQRMSSIEDCLISLMRDSQQQSEWRHQQKNMAVADNGRWGELAKQVADIHDELKALSTIRFEDVRELKKRVRDLESPEEVTQNGKR